MTAMMENEENNIGYYAVIPATVLFNNELKANEKLLYAYYMQLLQFYLTKRDIVMLVINT